jgi:hypothetical protein
MDLERKGMMEQKEQKPDFWKDMPTTIYPEVVTVMKKLQAMGYTVEAKNGGFHLRINDQLDVYPSNKRWHQLDTGDRGGYENMLALVKAMVK